MQHALDWCRDEENMEVEGLLLLQPTSPLRTSRHIDEAINVFRATNAETTVSVMPVGHIFHPAVVQRQDGNFLSDVFDSSTVKHLLSQDELYVRNGPAILINRPSVLDRGEKFGDTVASYVMEQEDSVDIDSPSDLQFADYLLQRRYQETESDQAP